MRKFVTLLSAVALVWSGALLAQDRFDRGTIIPVEADDIGGIGNIVAGVDFDGDGLTEMYAVNNDWHDVADKDLVPRIYKYERDANGQWSIVWSTRLLLNFQNTWPPLAAADLDNDGKWEIVWGPINNSGGGAQLTQERLVVFESAGDGSDMMGVANGDGTYRPNSFYDITSAAGANLRPFKWVIHDIDGDGTDEVVASARVGDGIQIYKVDNVSDAADTTDTWTTEFSGVTGTFYDIAVMGNTAYGIQSNGDVAAVMWDGSAYVAKPVQTGLVGAGSWNSAQTVDVDGDNTEEIIAASWSSSTSAVYLLQQSGDTLTSTMIKDVPDVANRLYGGAAGDMDGDDHLDFAFGTRSATPNGSIYRLEYQGGAIDDEANWLLQLVDSGVSEAQQYDVLTMADVDGNGEDNLIYTGTPRGQSSDDAPQPIVILQRVHPDAPIIRAVADVPNDQGRNVWVIWEGSADDNPGMRFDADLSGDQQVPPVVTSAHGKATFTLNMDQTALHYLVEVYNIDKVSASHIHVGAIGASGGVVIGLYSGTPAGPVNGMLAHGVITGGDVADWEAFLTSLKNGEYYVNVHSSDHPSGEIRGQIQTRPWQAPAMSLQGFTITKYVVWRIDGGRYPVSVAEVEPIQAHMYAAVVPTLGDGDPATYVVSAHTDNVLVNWKSLPQMGSSLDNLVPTAPVVLTTSGLDIARIEWAEMPDPDINYFTIRRSDQPGFDHLTAPEYGTTTELAFEDSDVRGGETWFYRIAAYDFNGNLGEFTEEIPVGILGVEDGAALPREFALEQNYPNPFNPETKIRFALPQAVSVTLKIYNIRGQLVKTLVNENKAAGTYTLTWDGSDNFGSKVASGTYIYSIKAGSFVENRKMVLLK